ncbi:MAG: chorismate synthase, partial [Pseudomonadota bacterium]
ASRVAAGGVAREAIKAIAPNIQIKGYMVQMGAKQIDRSRFDWAQIDQNDFFCPDAEAAKEWEEYLQWLRKDDHNSVGAIIEVVARGVPAGIGAPIYAKLDTDLAAAMMSINAVKGVEIGEGMAAAALTGRDNADEIYMGADGPEYSSNHAGGILGGISTGQDIVVRFAVKPTSSILSPRKSIRMDGTATEVITKGRHDPCVGIRAVPVGEAMMACVILDHLLLDRGQTGGVRGEIG